MIESPGENSSILVLGSFLLNLELGSLLLNLEIGSFLLNIVGSMCSFLSRRISCFAFCSFDLVA